jgi:hypothetical protein
MELQPTRRFQAMRESGERGAYALLGKPDYSTCTAPTMYFSSILKPMRLPSLAP